MGKKINRNCPVCDKLYLADETRLRHHHTITCSRECSYIYRGDKQRLSQEVPCAICGKHLSRIPHRINRNKNHYCSYVCRDKGRRIGIIVSCEVCGKDVYSSPHRLRRFCSTKCRDIGFTGSGSTSFNGGSTITREGYKRISSGNNAGRYEHTIIAEKQIGRHITSDEQVHHINGDKLDNRPTNLLVVTKSWHSKIHQRLKGR